MWFPQLSKGENGIEMFLSHLDWVNEPVYEEIDSYYNAFYDSAAESLCRARRKKGRTGPSTWRARSSAASSAARHGQRRTKDGQKAIRTM